VSPTTLAGTIDFRANGRAECDLFIALYQRVEEDALPSGAGRIGGLQAAGEHVQNRRCVSIAGCSGWKDVQLMPAWQSCL